MPSKPCWTNFCNATKASTVTCPLISSPSTTSRNGWRMDIGSNALTSRASGSESTKRVQCKMEKKGDGRDQAMAVRASDKVDNFLWSWFNFWAQDPPSYHQSRSNEDDAYKRWSLPHRGQHVRDFGVGDVHNTECRFNRHPHHPLALQFTNGGESDHGKEESAQTQKVRIFSERHS